MSRTHKYTISKKHVFVDNEPVLMYYIENMPFAFDVLEREEKQDKRKTKDKREKRKEK